MSWAFITALSQNPNQSYADLLNQTRGLLVGKYQQVPQLSVRSRHGLRASTRNI